MLNPYSNTDFFSFLFLFFKRVFLLFPEGLASDELQFLVLASIALSTSLLGTFLVLKKMTMFANALSHTLLFGIVAVYMALLFFTPTAGSHTHFLESLSFPFLLIASLVAVVVTWLLFEFLNKVVNLVEDLSIAFTFTTLFALGIFFVTLFAKNSHVGVELIMGNSDALDKGSLVATLIPLCANILFISLCFRRLSITTLDPSFSKTLSISPNVYHFILMVLTSITLMSSFRTIGPLMVLSFLVGPCQIARQFTYSLSRLLIHSAGIAMGITFIGVALSRHILTFMGYGLSTSGIIVTLFLVAYLATLTYSRLFKKMGA